MTLRSLVEPIRKILTKSRGHFIEAYAEDVDMSNKLVLISQTDKNGEKQQCYVPYDKLVIGVGSDTNTHGIDGLEHVHFLKTITDARRIRNKIMDNFERACLPTTSEEERKELLSFVVAGGGPTGVEFASELFDMIQEDLSPYVSPPSNVFMIVSRIIKKRRFCSYCPISIPHLKHLRRKNQRLRRT